MKYIIVDLEATCEQDNQGFMNEIIEIGAVKVNENQEITGEFCQFVKPKLNPVLSDFCKQLTSITQSQVDEAPSFDVALDRFKSWINTNEDYVLCSWGFYDKKQFQLDCKLHNLDGTWAEKHISLKHQFSKIKNMKKFVGMKKALRIEQIPLDGTHHRGIDDAKNINKIFLKNFDKWEYQNELERI